MNTEFNLHVSRLHIRSEHTIGFLKGQFPSLKGLWLQINHADMHHVATYWISACIAVHAFVFRIEREERGDDDDENYFDPFIQEGKTTSSSSSASMSEDLGPGSDSDHIDGQQTQARSRLLGAARRF